MKKLYRISIIMVIVLATAAICNATDLCTTWGCQGQIQTLYTSADGAIYVGMSGDEMAIQCTPVSGVYLSLSNSANKKEIYAMLLNSFITKTPILIRTIDGSPNCEIAYVSFETYLQ